MGYVARYQQFDPEAAPGDDPTEHLAAWPPPGPGHHPTNPGRHEAPPDQRIAYPARYEADPAAHAHQFEPPAEQPAVYPTAAFDYRSGDGLDQGAGYSGQFQTVADQRTVYADQYEIRAERPAAYPDQQAHPDQDQAYPVLYPTGDDVTAVFAGPGERLIDLSAPRQAPVEHRRPGQVRKGVLALAALAVMLAGGTGYVLLRDSGSGNSAAASARRSTDASVSPSAQPGDSTVPNGEPVHIAPASPVGSAATATLPPATVPTVISVVPAPTQPMRTVAPVTSSAPAPTAPTPTGGSASASAPATALTASYSYRTDGDDADPITGYLGTIRVTNSGDTTGDPWTVHLTVPSGTTATIQSGDVTTSRDGTTVTFRPSAGTLAAHDATMFTFTLSDPLTAVPTTCTINGAACS